MSNRTTSSNDPRLNTLAKMVVDKLDRLLEDLEVDAHISGKKYCGKCPIHGDSDNPAAFNIYYDGYIVPGYWKCRTKCCENKFGKNIIGFARGRLSRQKLKYHWKENPKAIYGFGDTVSYLCKFVGKKLNSIEIDEGEEEKRKFIVEATKLEKVLKHHNSNITRDKVRQNLIIPASYFIDRGFSPSILQQFDVGLAKKSKIDTKNRIIVPIYNKDSVLCGYTCRSMYEKCETCRLHHDTTEACPESDHDKALCSKWRHIGFNAQEHLYNYWNAFNHIKNTNVAVLVEGPGDVWKLEEHGVHNSVALFGHTLYDQQERLLARAQCMSMIVLTDSDQAGRMGAQEIQQKYHRLYRMYFPKLTEKDAGEMTGDAITAKIIPYIEAAKYL